MTNLPPEPDEFQTRMRSPQGEDDTEKTTRPGEQIPAAPQSPFAPPGFGGAAQAPPPGYGPPTAQPQPAQPQSAQPGQQAAPSTPFGQPPAAPQQPAPSFGQASFGQQQPAGQSSFGQASFGQQQPGYGQPAQQQGPFGQPAAGQQSPTGYPQGGFGQASFGQQAAPQPGQPQAGPWGPQPPKDANPIKAAFDFSFNAYATPGIVKITYIVGIVLAVVSWILGVITMFTAFGGQDLGYGVVIEGSPIPGVLTLLFGWIPAAFFILLLRLALEQALSSVRTATDVRVLRERSDSDATKD